MCGSYFSSSSFGFDFIHIPGAEKATTGAQVGSNICGRNCGLLTTGGGDDEGGDDGELPPGRRRRSTKRSEMRPMARSGTLAGGKSICCKSSCVLIGISER